jgi:hypothetical protein
VDLISANYTIADDAAAWGVSEDLLAMSDEEWAATMLLSSADNATGGTAWDWNSTWSANMYSTPGMYNTSLASNVSYTRCSAPNQECVNTMNVSEAAQLYDAATGIGCSMTSDFWLNWELKKLVEGDNIPRAPSNRSGYYSQPYVEATTSTAGGTTLGSTSAGSTASSGGDQQSPPQVLPPTSALTPSSNDPGGVLNGAATAAPPPVQTVLPSSPSDAPLQLTTNVPATGGVSGAASNATTTAPAFAASPATTQTATPAPDSASPLQPSSSPAVHAGVPEPVQTDGPQVMTYTVTTGISLAGRQLHSICATNKLPACSIHTMLLLHARMAEIGTAESLPAAGLPSDLLVSKQMVIITEQGCLCLAEHFTTRRLVQAVRLVNSVNCTSALIDAADENLRHSCHSSRPSTHQCCPVFVVPYLANAWQLHAGETPSTFTEDKVLAFRTAVAKLASVAVDRVTILEVKESMLALRRRLLEAVAGIEVTYEVSGGLNP